MTTVEVPGARLTYDTAGNPGDPAIVFIHAGVATRVMWDPQFHDLAHDHFVVRYDTRGFGESPGENVQFANRDDLIRILDAVGLERATLVGCSRGGGIALDTALEHPDRVAGLVTIGSTPSGMDFSTVPSTDLERELEADMERVDEAQDVEALIRIEVMYWDLGPERGVDDVRPEFLARAIELNTGAAHFDFAGEHRALTPPAIGRLGEVSAPALIVVGDFDVTEARVGYDLLDGGNSRCRGSSDPRLSPPAERRAPRPLHHDPARLAREALPLADGALRSPGHGERLAEGSVVGSLLGLQVLGRVAEHRAGHRGCVVVEEAEQHGTVDALAHLAQHPSDRLVNEGLPIAEQALRDLDGGRGVAVPDELMGRDHRDPAIPERRGRGEVEQQRSITIEQPAADDLRRARVDDVPVVDPPAIDGGEVAVEHLLRLSLVPRHEQQHRGEAALVVRVVEQPIDLVEREVAEAPHDRARRRHPNAEQDVSVAVLPGGDSDVRPKQHRVLGVARLREGRTHIIRRRTHPGSLEACANHAPTQLSRVSHNSFRRAGP